MGGDNSPHAVIDGLAIAHKKNPDVNFLIFGDEEKVKPLLRGYPSLEKSCELRHTTIKIHNEDKPGQVIRNKQSSMHMAITAVKNKEARAVISAGNTGALMAISKLVLRTLAGIHRPAIMAIMPSKSKQYVMLDLGANTECDAINLVEFALMGSIMSKSALNVKKPKVGLLNIGAEEMKGKAEIQEAAKILSKLDLDIEFIGYIEPDQMGEGVADVVVSDGFTGNIALKSVEGTAKLVVRLLKDAIKSSWLAWLGLPFLIPALKNVKKTMDPRLYNGAMFTGLNGLSVKSHGGTDSLGFSVAVNNTISMVRENFTSTLKTELEEINLEEVLWEVNNDSE
jgi:glycerol-3-phosphate acyltransferase PlsX